MKEATAIVTGGAGGIGAAIGRVLREDGWKIVLADRSNSLETVAREIGASYYHCNVIEEAECRALIESCDRIGALINCAGISGNAPLLDLDIELWRRVLEVNLTAPLRMTQLAARRMAEHGEGSIVNIASISGLRAGVSRTAYGTSKAALVHLTRQAALELAPLGIRCNAVAPGPVDTELTRGIYSDAMRHEYLRAIPQNRFSTKEEVADTVAFLCSAKARNITGQCLAVDGGYSSAGIGVPTAQSMHRQG